ncbi:MAG: DUF5985 family protein [Allosphingosinicella sp.]
MTPIVPAIVYLLCFATSSACAFLLFRTHRRSGARLLLWSGLCFSFLAANNLLVILDLLLIPELDMRLARLLLSLAAVAILLFGFVWDGEDA